MNVFDRHPIVTRVLKLAVGVAILAGLVSYVDFDRVLASLAHADALMLAAGTLLVPLNLWLQFYRWRFLLRLLAPDLGNKDVLVSLFVGFSAGFFTPAQVGEYGGRLAGLRTFRIAHVLGLGMLDRLYILGVTVIAGCIVLPGFLVTYIPATASGSFSGILFAVAALLMLVFLFPRLARRAFSILPQAVRTHRFYDLVSVVESNLHTREARHLFATSALFLAVVVAQYHLFVNAFAPTPIAVSMLCVPAILLVKSVILPVSIGDLGIREGAAVFFFSRAGIPAAAALNASLSVFLINVLLPSVIGALLLMTIRTPADDRTS